MKPFDYSIDNFREALAAEFPDCLQLTEREMWIENFFMERIVPWDMEQLIEYLKKKFIHLGVNWDLIKRGVQMREQMIADLSRKPEPPEQPEGDEGSEPSAAAGGLTLNDVKLMEAKLSLFNKLAAHNATLARMIDEMSGTVSDKVKKIEEIEREVREDNYSDSPGFAQEYLKNKEREA